jgi:hypothetical protein
MKRIIAMLTASAAFVGLVVWGTTEKKNITSLPVVHADAPKGCSLETVAGNWTVSDTGTVIGIGPRAAVGTFTFSGEGNVLNGVATSSLNGTIAGETFSGTYTVNSNCTGTINIEIFDASSGAELFAVTLYTAFDDKSQEMRGLFTSVSLPNGAGSLPTTISVTARKQ